MPLEGDERAVTVVIGAVLMFGILVTSLAMYQVNVVPDQNQQVEWDHHQEVTADLLDLRNAIVNAGYENGTRETSISLGTQYESRTFSINPPDPRGTIRTNATGNPEVEVTFGNGATESFDTSYIEYEPGYNEYDAPTTVIEHGLIYDEHGHVNVTRDAGGVISDERIVIPLIEGDLSESSRSSASITVETIDVYHVSSDVDEIRLSTNAFEAWDDSYAEVEPENGDVLLTDVTQDVYVARIAVGDDRSESDGSREDLDQFGEPVTNRGGSGETNEFDLRWADDSVSASPGETASLTAEIDGDVENARADFSLRDSNDSVASYEPSDPVAFRNGEASFEVTLANEATDSDHVDVYVSSGGTTKVATLTVDDSTPESGLAVSILGTNSPVNVGETLEVTAEVTNTGTSPETQTITLETDGQQRDSTDVTVSGSRTTTVTLTWQPGNGDGGEYTALVSSEDHSATTGVTVSDLRFVGNQGTTDRNGDGRDSLVEFDVVNDRSDDISLTGVTVIASSTSANEIDGGGRWWWTYPEAQVDVSRDGDGDASVSRNRPFDLGERMDFDTPPTLSSSEGAEYSIGEFRTDGTTVDMNGESVTVVLYYEDGNGTERSVEFTIDDL